MGWLVRSAEHIDYAWLRVSECDSNRWMYSHRHGTVFATQDEALQAATDAITVWRLQNGGKGMELSIVSNESLETMYGTFAKLVPESR